MTGFLQSSCLVQNIHMYDIYIYNHIFACPVVVKSLNCITLHISVLLIHVFRDVKVNIINKYRSDIFLKSLDVPILHGLLDCKLIFK